MRRVATVLTLVSLGCAGVCFAWVTTAGGLLCVAAGLLWLRNAVRA